MNREALRKVASDGRKGEPAGRERPSQGEARQADRGAGIWRKGMTDSPIANDDFEHDALMLRTTGPHGEAHEGFVWPRVLGAIVRPVRWDLAPTCGDGLHGLLDGLGDNALLSSDPAALWWVVGVRLDEVVRIDDDKVKAPRAKVVYFGGMPGAYKSIIRNMHRAAHAATTDDGAHAATTGDGASAATTGDWAHAATTGDGASAATTGDWAVAAALGARALVKAGRGGAICAVRRDHAGKLLAIRATMIGQDGTKPGVWYRLNEKDEFEAVGDTQ